MSASPSDKSCPLAVFTRAEQERPWFATFVTQSKHLTQRSANYIRRKWRYHRSPGRCVTHRLGSLKITVDTRYADKEEVYVQRVCSMIENSPIAHPGLLREVQLRFEKTKQKKAIANASPRTSQMRFFRTATGQPFLRQLVFDHEMAHLVGTKIGGPPERKLWRRARHLDAEYLKGCDAELLQRLHQGIIISGTKQSFVEDAEFITDYARRSAGRTDQVEDWAESVAHYCYASRRGHLLKFKGKRVLFEHLFPHRAQLIKAYTESLNVNVQSMADRPQLIRHTAFSLPSMTFQEIVRQGETITA